jgi:hypothetical protein
MGVSKPFQGKPVEIPHSLLYTEAGTWGLVIEVDTWKDDGKSIVENGIFL